MLHLLLPKHCGIRSNAGDYQQEPFPQPDSHSREAYTCITSQTCYSDRQAIDPVSWLGPVSGWQGLIAACATLVAGDSRLLRAEEEEEDEDGLGEPLILRIDQDDQGSVGSEDTTRFDSDDDMPPIEAGEPCAHVVVYCGKSVGAFVG